SSSPSKLSFLLANSLPTVLLDGPRRAYGGPGIRSKSEPGRRSCSPVSGRKSVPADSPVARCDAESRLHEGANPKGRGRMFFRGFDHLPEVALLEMVMTSLCQRPSRNHPSSRTG